MQFKDSVEKTFRFGEDIVYAIIGVLLLLTAIILVIHSAISIFHNVFEQDFVQAALHVMERMLLAIMIVEILYTVRESIKTHTLCSEPFFIVGIIAAVRRILVISVESAYVHERFNAFMIETGILGLIILVFVISIYLLRKRPAKLNN